MICCMCLQVCGTSNLATSLLANNNSGDTTATVASALGLNVTGSGDDVVSPVAASLINTEAVSLFVIVARSRHVSIRTRNQPTKEVMAAKKSHLLELLGQKL